MVVELRHFDKYFVKNTRKRGAAGKLLGAFSPRYCQTYIVNGKFYPKMDTTRAFLPKIRKLFSVFKKSSKTNGKLSCRLFSKNKSK